jgi:hypothetical protein
MFEKVPASPGVYYLLGVDDRLMYVGQASDLRRRLRDHARSLRWDHIKKVCFETVNSPDAALAREADVLAALRPPWNKAQVDDYFSFVVVGPKGVKLAKEGDYGCFPHLGKGALSASGRACIDGFDALARIVKTTRPEENLVRQFLAGRSDGLLREELDIDQPHIRHGVQRDRRLASRFYQAGPRAMRALRLRHGGRGPVSRDEFTAWITQEVHTLISAPAVLRER